MMIIKQVKGGGGVYISSVVDEGIRTNFKSFFTRRFHMHKKRKKHKKHKKHEKHKTSNKRLSSS